MKPNVTPPRRRSLFERGYDRSSLNGKFISKPRIVSSRNLRILLVLGCVGFAAIGVLFFLGYVAARSNKSTDITSTEAENKPSQVISEDKILLRTPFAKRLKIAVAVTVTKDGKYLDGAAVLQHSIRMTNSKHELEMVAIVHSEVQSTRPALKALGFRVMEFPAPVLSKDIKKKHLRDTIDKSGCCGALELLKLCVWKLDEYDLVVSMDMDAIWLENLDHLFEKQIEKGGLMFTYDFAMDNPGSKVPPVQGGFLIVRPSQEVFERLVNIVIEGDFRPSTGWGGLHIGWCWGGQTVQGLLAYFTYLEPKLVIALDPCEYNSMATTPSCRRVDFGIVKSIHYTACQKPWECHLGDNNICAQFLHSWWLVRNNLEQEQGLTPTGRCCGGGSKKFCPERGYTSLNIEEMNKKLSMNDFNKNPTKGHIVQVPQEIPSRE